MPDIEPIESILGGQEVRLAPDLVATLGRGRIDVSFKSGRRQSIRHKVRDRLYIFTSAVARPSTVKKHGEGILFRRILERNRATEIVGFRLTKRGGIEAFLRHRADTIQREELLFFLSVLAREADRFEYLLTGRDIH